MSGALKNPIECDMKSSFSDWSQLWKNFILQQPNDAPTVNKGYETTRYNSACTVCRQDCRVALQGGGACGWGLWAGPMCLSQDGVETGDESSVCGGWGDVAPRRPPPSHARRARTQPAVLALDARRRRPSPPPVADAVRAARLPLLTSIQAERGGDPVTAQRRQRSWAPGEHRRPLARAPVPPPAPRRAIPHRRGRGAHLGALGDRQFDAERGIADSRLDGEVSVVQVAEALVRVRPLRARRPRRPLRLLVARLIRVGQLRGGARRVVRRGALRGRQELLQQLVAGLVRVFVGERHGGVRPGGWRRWRAAAAGAPVVRPHAACDRQAWRQRVAEVGAQLGVHRRLAPQRSRLQRTLGGATGHRRRRPVRRGRRQYRCRLR